MEINSMSMMSFFNPMQKAVDGIVNAAKPRLLTYEAEGSDDEKSRFYTGHPHVPSDSSGVTLGHGYDLSQRTPDEVKNDLSQIGMSRDKIALYVQAADAKKTGDNARRFIAEKKLGADTLTLPQRGTLFNIIYEKMEKDAGRFYSSWVSINPAIRAIIVDLRFRGDLTADSRRLIQDSVQNNNLKGLLETMSKKSNWPKVPPDRVTRRIDFLQDQVGMSAKLNFKA